MVLDATTSLRGRELVSERERLAFVVTCLPDERHNDRLHSRVSGNRTRVYATSTDRLAGGGRVRLIDG